MYQPMKEDHPQSGYPQGYPQGGYPQGAYGYPQGGDVPPVTTPQGGYFPPGTIPQGGYPPQVVPPQGGNPTQGDLANGGYPPPAPGFQLGYAGEGLNMSAGGYGPGAGLGEDGEVKGFDFTEKSIRRAFIRKVYAILMAQLLVTLSTITLFVFHLPTKMWVHRNPMVLIVAVVVMFVCLISMACCTDMRRRAPTNFIFLGLFTVAESILLGVISSQYESETVMMAVGITAAICLALTLFAMQTRFDFTVMGGALLCALVVLILFGLIAIFIPKTIVSMLYASAGALLFSLYLIYDTQLMMGGEHKYTISPEEYVFAALNLYLDIINLFLFILRIVGAARG